MLSTMTGQPLAFPRVLLSGLNLSEAELPSEAGTSAAGCPSLSFMVTGLATDRRTALSGGLALTAGAARPSRLVSRRMGAIPTAARPPAGPKSLSVPPA